MAGGLDTVAELTRRNKAEASRRRREAERYSDLRRDAETMLAEAIWRGLILPTEDRAALEKATTRKGIREMPDGETRALVDHVGKAIAIAAFANTRRLRDVALGKTEELH